MSHHCGRAIPFSTRPFLFLALRSSSWNRMPEKGREGRRRGKEKKRKRERAMSALLRPFFSLHFSFVSSSMCLFLFIIKFLCNSFLLVFSIVDPQLMIQCCTIIGYVMISNLFTGCYYYNIFYRRINQQDTQQKTMAFQLQLSLSC